MPFEFVEEYRKLSSGVFTIQTLNGKSLRLSSENRLFGSLVIDPWVIDYNDFKPRRPRIEDVKNNSRIGDALEEVSFTYCMDMPAEDVPEESSYIKTIETFVLNTTKHIMAAPASIDSLHNWIEVAEIIAQGNPLSQRPIITLNAPVTTPLNFYPINAEILKEAIKHELHICAQTEPIAGLTAPYSFAGGLLMGNCENLFLIVMAQVLRPGTPVLYSIGNARGNMMNGSAIFYPADKVLWKIASSQMARFYGLSIEAEATGSSVGCYDTQNGIEHALHLIPAVSGCGGLFNGLGSFANACGMSPEMIVIHAELIHLLNRVFEGIIVTDKTLGIDSILSRFPESFLDDSLTIDMLYNGEFFNGKCFDQFDANQLNNKSMIERAHARVEEILSTHRTDLDETRIQDIQNWAQKKYNTK